MRMTDVMETNLTDKIDLKGIEGSSRYANAMVQGKSELAFALSCGSFSAGLLNGLWLDGNISQGSAMRREKVTLTVDDSKSADWVIRELVALNVARLDSFTGVKIGSATASNAEVVTISPIDADTVKQVGTWLYFALADKGKTAFATYVSNGTTIVTTFKIPNKLSFNIAGFSDAAPIVKNDTVKLRQDDWSVSAVPVANHYLNTGGGVLYFKEDITIASGKGNMPPFADIFTPEQLRDVAAYVATRLKLAQ
jgi:hypothetical protein